MMIKRILLAAIWIWGLICLTPLLIATSYWLFDASSPYRREFWMIFGIGFMPGLTAWILIPIVTFIRRKELSRNEIILQNTITMSAIICWCICILAERTAEPIGTRYLIPDGYAGWVSISYGVETAPLLPKEGKVQIVRFPEGGKLETASQSSPGDQYYFYYSGNSQRPIDIAKELGGGGTVQDNKDIGTKKFAYQFWVSRDAHRDFDLYVSNKPTVIGPFPNYQSAR